MAFPAAGPVRQLRSASGIVLRWDVAAAQLHCPRASLLEAEAVCLNNPDLISFKLINLNKQK